jgi:hypothetical protein
MVTIEQTTVADGLMIPRMINGLWQLADMKVDIPHSAKAMESLYVIVSSATRETASCAVADIKSPSGSLQDCRVLTWQTTTETQSW